MTERLSLMEKSLLGTSGAAFLAWSASPIFLENSNINLFNYYCISTAGITCLSAISFLLSRSITDMRQCYKHRNYRPLKNNQESIK